MSDNNATSKENYPGWSDSKADYGRNTADKGNYFEHLAGHAVIGMRAGTAAIGIFTVPFAAAVVLNEIAQIRGVQYENYFLDRMVRTDGTHFLDAITGRNHFNASTNTYTSPWTGETGKKGEASVMAGRWGDYRLEQYLNSGGSLAQTFKSVTLFGTTLATGAATFLAAGAIATVSKPVTAAIGVGVAFNLVAGGTGMNDANAYTMLPTRLPADAPNPAVVPSTAVQPKSGTAPAQKVEVLGM